MRGRMALHVAGIELEHREILLRDKPQAMLDVSPKGTVPVLVISDTEVIDESLDVMHWALAQRDPRNWLAGDTVLATDLITTNDGPFKHHLDRYKYASRYNDSAQRGDVDLTHREAAETYIQSLETRLEHGPYLLGEAQTLADIAIFPFIRQFANTDREWWSLAPYAKTRDWLTRHTDSELFKDIMVKYPLWIPEKCHSTSTEINLRHPRES